MQEGIYEPVFYGDLVCKFKSIVGKPNFSDPFKKIKSGVQHIKQQSACLVVNPITIYSYVFFFNCTTVGRASDSMTALTQSFHPLVAFGWTQFEFSLALYVSSESYSLFHHSVLI